MRQRVISDVAREDLSRDDVDPDVGDNVTRVPAPNNYSSGTRRTNVHTQQFGANQNDPSSRFASISRAYGSLERLQESLAQAMSGPPPMPARTMDDISREYAANLTRLANAPEEHKHVFQRILNSLSQELEDLVSNVTSNTATTSSNGTSNDTA